MSDTGSCHYSNGSLYKTKGNISTKLEQSTNILNVVATVLEKFMMTMVTKQTGQSFEGHGLPSSDDSITSEQSRCNTANLIQKVV